MKEKRWQAEVWDKREQSQNKYLKSKDGLAQASAYLDTRNPSFVLISSQINLADFKTFFFQNSARLSKNLIFI